MKKCLLSILFIISIIIIMLLLIGIIFPKKYLNEIRDNANKYGLDESMIASVINIESGYDEKAQSTRGAMGLMQILPSTAMEVVDKIGLNIDDISDIYDVEINIEIGCFYLRYLLDYFNGSIINTLCAYNWGMRNVQDWINAGNVDNNGEITNIPVEETRNYIAKYNLNKYVYDYIYNF